MHNLFELFSCIFHLSLDCLKFFISFTIESNELFLKPQYILKLILTFELQIYS